MRLSEFANKAGLDKLVQNVTQAFNKSEYDALIHAAAYVASASQPSSGAPVTATSTFYEDCEDLQWMKAFPKSKIAADFSAAMVQHGRNRVVAERATLEMAENIKSEGVAQRIIAVLCNMASADGTFDGEELRRVHSVAKSMAVSNEALESIVTQFDGSVMALKKGSAVHGKPGWA